MRAVRGWRALAGGLHATIATDDFKTALGLVDRISPIAEQQGNNLGIAWFTHGGSASRP
jgi:pterin-4a-carbinolamine dehydratase